MKAQTKKKQVLAEFQRICTGILTEVSTLSSTQRDEVFLGIWSTRDLLAHLAGWDFTNLEAVKSVLAGKLPPFYEYHDRDWQMYNAIRVQKHGKNSFRDLIGSVKHSHKELVDFLQTIPPGDFNRDLGVRFRGYKVTVQRLLEAEMKDELVHHQQIVDHFGCKK